VSEARRYDICIVGGGLVGLATARALQEAFDGVSILILEKENRVAAHQSSHNSGVVHSGLYYPPGSLKAQLCVEGRHAIKDLCLKSGIRFNESGKLVVASRASEIGSLDELERRGKANGLQGMRRLRGSEIAEVEPAATGLEALHIHETGVADFEGVANHLAAALVESGASIVTDAEVSEIVHHVGGVDVHTGIGQFSSRILVNCAGLHSDRVAEMAGLSPEVQVIPFRGEYYRLTDNAAVLVKSLIYPVPDPRYPFLGVHFTRRYDGSVEVGPNALLALGREHYRGSGVDWTELRSIMAYPGFRKLAFDNWRSGTSELVNSKSKRLYARLAQRLVPELRSQDLLVGGSGVRAQAVDRSGQLVDDFVIEVAGSTVHVLNAPSPAATASIAIGRHIGRKVRPMLEN